MAVRPVFFVAKDGAAYVDVRLIDFGWFPGMAKSQRQKCVDSLHEAIRAGGTKAVLEISTKSREQLGIKLSAFNLGFIHPKSNQFICVESAFQGSKVFEREGPFPDLYARNASETKKFLKGRDLGRLVEFNFYGQHWPLNPFTLFYDWLYLNSMRRNPRLAQQACEYECFTDIEFNPKRSINCQAYAAALFVSLCRRGKMEETLENRDTYIHALQQQPDWISRTAYGKHHPNANGFIL